jgi:ATP-dependent protease HslVU (ClpYQ) peptidase subunit
MTTIAVTCASDRCVIMSESGITDESFHTAPPMNKIVRQGDWLIAAAGADRVCDVVQYLTKYPVIPPTIKHKEDEQEWFRFVAKRVVPVIRKTAQEELSLDVKDGVAELPESEIMLVTHGRAFSISNTLGISKVEPYWAIGSGGSLALGSLATTQTNKDWNTRLHIYTQKAIQVAIKHDSFSHPPVYGYISHRSGKIVKWDSTDLV